MPVNVTGLAEVSVMLDKQADPKNMDLLLRRLALITLEYAQAYGAVDTGEMVGSIEYQRVKDTHHKVECLAAHGIYNEFGVPGRMPAGSMMQPVPVISTSGKPAYRPFMRPAAIQALLYLPLFVKEIYT